MDAFNKLSLKAAQLTGQAATALMGKDYHAAYLSLAESLNIQKLLHASPDLIDRTAALMTEIAQTMETVPSVKKAEIARLKENLAILESQAATLERESAMSVIRADWSKK